MHAFIQRAQKLSLLNNVKYKQRHDQSVSKLIFPVHYKHRYDQQPLSKSIQDEIDQIDIEQLIANAHDDAVTIYNDLEVLDLLQQKHVLGLNPLSAYIFEYLNTNSQTYNFPSQVEIIDREEFGLAADDDNEEVDSDNSTYENSSSDDDNADNEEQEITTVFINTKKRDFFGTKVYDADVQNTCFKVSMNNQTKYLHKQSACWLLTEETNKLSNDRLLRVMQNRREE